MSLSYFPAAKPDLDGGDFAFGGNYRMNLVDVPLKVWQSLSRSTERDEAMACIHCGTEKVLARGLCQPCYNRLRKTGSVERTYVRNTGHCSVEGCPNASFAKNLCAHHYSKAEHPLKAMWRNLRSRSPGQYPIEWDKFDVFQAAVGERPTPKHQLRRLNGGEPWAVGNMAWLAPVNPGADYYSTQKRSDYSRAWNLLRRFKLTGEEYAVILAEQGGGCAVCGQKETHTYKSGRLKDLSVDHDHATGAVRGLLCFNCNQGIGRLKDDPALLRRAALYIEHYAAEHAKTEAA